MSRTQMLHIHIAPVLAAGDLYRRRTWRRQMDLQQSRCSGSRNEYAHSKIRVESLRLKGTPDPCPSTGRRSHY